MKPRMGWPLKLSLESPDAEEIFINWIKLDTKR